MISRLFMRPKMLQRTYTLVGTNSSNPTTYEEGSIHMPAGIYNITVSAGGGGGGGMDTLYLDRPGGYGALGGRQTATVYYYKTPRVVLGGYGLPGSNHPNLSNGRSGSNTTLFELDAPTTIKYTLFGGAGGPLGTSNISTNNPINPLAPFAGRGAYFTGSEYLNATAGGIATLSMTIIG